MDTMFCPDHGNVECINGACRTCEEIQRPRWALAEQVWARLAQKSTAAYAAGDRVRGARLRTAERKAAALADRTFC